jgi:hypothetical protein
METASVQGGAVKQGGTVNGRRRSETQTTRKTQQTSTSFRQRAASASQRRSRLRVDRIDRRGSSRSTLRQLTIKAAFGGTRLPHDFFPPLIRFAGCERRPIARKSWRPFGYVSLFAPLCVSI